MSRNEPEYLTVDEVWVPKSQILEESKVHGKGDSGELAIPRWLAEEKEII